MSRPEITRTPIDPPATLTAYFCPACGLQIVREGAL